MLNNDYVRQDQRHGGVDNGGVVRKGVSDGEKAERNVRGSRSEHCYGVQKEQMVWLSW